MRLYTKLKSFMMPLKGRPFEWLCRYSLAELIAIIFSVSGVQAAYILGHGALTACLLGTWSENVGYYGFVVWRELKVYSAKGEKASGIGVTRDLFIEFGIAEILDSLLFRPASMYLALYLVKDHTLAAIIGKFLADIGFYSIAIIGYETRRAVAARSDVQMNTSLNSVSNDPDEPKIAA